MGTTWAAERESVTESFDGYRPVLSEMDRHRFPEKARRAVELVMRQAAYRYGKGASEEEVWGIAGMLHDADYEKWPEDHPNRIVAWLRDRGEGRIAYAVSAHYTPCLTRARSIGRFSPATSSLEAGCTRRCARRTPSRTYKGC